MTITVARPFTLRMIDPGTARGRFINARTWVSSAPHVGSFHGDAWTALVGVRKPVTNMKACFTAKATAPSLRAPVKSKHHCTVT